MSTEGAAPGTAPRGAQGGKLLVVSLVAIVAISLVGSLVYLSFAKEPVALGSLVVVGPECFSQPATRVEMSYMDAKKAAAGDERNQPGKREFGGILFYTKVPWGKEQQSAQVGPR